MYSISSATCWPAIFLLRAQPTPSFAHQVEHELSVGMALSSTLVREL